MKPVQIQLTVEQYPAYEQFVTHFEKEGYITKEQYLEIFNDTVPERMSPLNQMIQQGVIFTKDNTIFYPTSLVFQ